MSQKSFKMVVERGDNASLFDSKLVSEVNGNSKAGYVFTIYAQLADMQQLNQADTLERREKHLILDETSDKNVRTTLNIHKVNDIGFYATTKLQYANSEAIEQVQVPISEAFYNHLAITSLHGIRFERFKINVPNTEMTWEIDVFRDTSGQRCNWVKMDLEVEKLDNEIPPLPVECVEYIMDFPGIVTKEQAMFIEKLYRNYWVSLDPEWIKSKLDFKEQMGWRQNEADEQLPQFNPELKQL